MKGLLRPAPHNQRMKTTLKPDLKSIYVQYGDGEGFIARVDPTIDALRQPAEQQRVQDLGNSVSTRETHNTVSMETLNLVPMETGDM